jgi:hypothetical protein
MVAATLYEQITMIVLYCTNKRAISSYIVNQVCGRLLIARSLSNYFAYAAEIDKCMEGRE